MAVRRSSPKLALAVGAVCAMALAACSAAQAQAATGESEPLAITAFTTQTTEPSAVVKTANEPYYFDQAGGHPFALTSTVQFALGDPKSIVIDLPPGLLANPQAVPGCSAQSEHCPADTQVGVFSLQFKGGGKELKALGAIVNMTPYPGLPAEFGLEIPFLGRVLLAGRLLHTAQGYTLAIVANGLPILGLSRLFEGASYPALQLSSLQTTLWGVPAAASHNPLRGLTCVGGSELGESCPEEGGVPSGVAPAPFLTMPSVCTGEAPTTVVWADSWEQPADYTQARSTLPQMSHCERSPFSPEVSVRPEATRPEVGDGINLIIHVRQFNATITAAPELRGASVTLPQGMSINPAAAGGLQGCNASGPEGIDIPTGLNASGQALAPQEIGVGEEIPAQGAEEPLLAAGHCPNASIVGSAEAITPLLAHPIEGRVYIANPQCGGAGQGGCTEEDALDGRLYRLYVQLGAGANIMHDEGVLLKLGATVQVNPASGQLTVRLAESPQLPLSELSLHLYGGDRGLLVNPARCGAATTTSDLEAWSAPYTPDATPSSYFNVEGCTAHTTFDPGFLAGSLNTAAGAFSPFALSVTRPDGEENLKALQVHAPPGLSAMLSSVPVCSGVLASSGECPEASRVGSSSVSVGEGSEPLEMPGEVYLTGPYAGGPFGLAIVTSAHAGPLNLGRLVIRARIGIDPQSAALTITSDPLPQIVLGVPLRIRKIRLTLDRPNFILNPTNCDPQQVSATVVDALGASTNVSNGYALADCRSLAFRPKLVASSGPRTSLGNGASLDIKVTFPKGAQGTQANIARIKVALPQQLPTRLSSLQNSCPEHVFESDPGGCPGSSIVGIAKARTPVLGGELEGPVYLVAHGGNVLPSPVVVLQGDGVALELLGSTEVEKSGIDSVAFNSTPDIPLSALELFLPAGPHSMLGGAANLCAAGKQVRVARTTTSLIHGRRVPRTVRVRKRLAAALLLHSEFAAHNGAVVHQTTQIAVRGCASRGGRVGRVR